VARKGRTTQPKKNKKPKAQKKKPPINLHVVRKGEGGWERQGKTAAESKTDGTEEGLISSVAFTVERSV